MRKITLLVISIILFYSSSYSWASLFIDDIYTTDKGRWYIDFSADYYRNVEKSFDDESAEVIKAASRELETAAYISYGLTDKWDAGMTLPYEFENSRDAKVNGFSDIVIESKYRFLDEKGFWPGFALYFDVKPPTANKEKGLSSGKTDYTINTIFTKNVGKYVFDLNLGYFFVAGADDVLFYSFDIGRELTEKLSVCAEIYAENTFKGNFDDNIFIGALSFDYQINEFISLEVGAGGGISKSSPDYQLSSTLAFTF